MEVERRTSDGGALEMHAEYKYDVFGLRNPKVVDSDGDGAADLTQRYALDGWDVFADLDASSSLTTR